MCLSMCSGLADSGWAVPSVQCGSHSQDDGGREGAHSWAPYEPSGHATPWPRQRSRCCHGPTCSLHTSTFSGVYFESAQFIYSIWKTLRTCRLPTLCNEVKVQTIHNWGLTKHWVHSLRTFFRNSPSHCASLPLHVPGSSHHSRLCHGPQRTAHPHSWWPVWSWVCPHHKLRRQHSCFGCPAEECGSRGRSIRRIHWLRYATSLPCYGLPAAHPWRLPDILILRIRPLETTRAFFLPVTEQPLEHLNSASYNNISWTCEEL